MPGSRRPLSVRSLALVGVVALSTVTLAACTASKPSDAGASKSPAASSAAGGASLRSKPFTIDCATLEPTATVSAAYPGYSPAPATGTPFGDASLIKQAKGQLCSWTSASGDTMTLAVGQFATSSLTAVKNGLVESSNSVPTYGVEGYFTVSGKIGVAEAFSDPYWIVATSSAFVEPGSAQPFVAAAVSALKAAG